MNRIVAKSYIWNIILIIFCVFGTVSAKADGIKVLPVDPSVRAEIMPNGLACYVVTNPMHKGRADFALVQNTGFKTAQNIDSDRLIGVSREALSSQRRLLSPTVQEFFTSHGATAGKDGFVKVTDDATLYHFRNVNISTSTDVVDSTILVLMGMVERVMQDDDSFLREWYTPADQAIIVAGDVDPAKIIEKIRTLSYMVSGFKSAPRREYVWKSRDGVEAEVLASFSELSSFKAQWRLPRAPKKNMNTVQPLVVDMYMNELAILAQKRIGRSLMQASIPYASVKCEYIIPVNHLDDDVFSVEVIVLPEDIETAVSITSSTLASLAEGQISVTDQENAELTYFDNRYSYVRELTNAMHVRRCASAFLYNESLAADAAKNSFLMTRYIEDSTELKIFKSIAAASVTPDANLSLLCSVPEGSLTREKLLSIFTEGWNKTAEETVSASSQTGYSLTLPETKIKVKSSKKEYLSNGTIMTLSNGMKAVVKPTDAKDVIHWSLSLNGGFGNISDLEAGEAPYVSEFLDMCTVAGISSEDFKEAIRRKGITMDIEVGHSRTTLSGRMPDDGIEDLMGILLMVMDSFAPDQAVAEYRMKCEPLVLKAKAGTLEDRISVVDSVMCPGYRYSNRKSGFDKDFMRKSEEFYRDLFAKVDDGVMVFVGDVDEKMLKDVLVKYAGAFRTSGRKASRPVVSYQPISGTVRVERMGKENGVDIVMSAPMPATAANWYAVELASMCLSKQISKIVTGRGLHVRLKHNCDLYPQERVSVMISLRDASINGFAPGTSSHEPMEALSAVRNLLKDPDSISLTDKELASYKAYLKQVIKRRQAEPEYWHDVVALRYIEGKDFISSYEAKIDALTIADVMNQLKQLSQGARVEYIIKRK